jgi:hypothetical protein
VNQVLNQVWNQVKSQVADQVGNQVSNQVAGQVLSQVLDQVNNQVVNQIRSEVRDQFVKRVWSQVVSQVLSQVKNQVSNQVNNQVWNQVWGQVKSQVADQLADQLADQVRNQVGDGKIIYPYFDCQFWATYFSYYEFMRHELGVKFSNITEYESFLACHSYGMVWPTPSLCVVCQPPSIIKKNSRGLHCEDGPAVSYSGLNEIYALNGITVPKELVMTPAEDLSIELFKSEKNADVKAEFVRKYGIERMLDMGKLVDTFENYPDQAQYDWWWKSQYELHDMSAVFTDIPYQPYLKMMNFTTHIWHMEAVSPACRTLRDALKERFGGREMKIIAGA